MKKNELHKPAIEKNKNKQLPITTNFGFKNIYFFTLVAALIAITYGATIGFDYSYFDDDAVIIKNQEVYSHINNIGISFTTDAELSAQKIELYRPLQSITYFIDAAIGGVKPGMFHFSNMLFHLLTCLALFFLLIKLEVNVISRYFFTVLFAIHPLFTHAVAWIPARGDLLLALTVILSISMYISFEKTNRNIFLFLHFIFFMLALLAKETAVFTGPLCVLYASLVLKKKWFRNQNYFHAAFYILITLIYLYLRKISISPVTTGSFGLSAFVANFPTIPELFSVFILPVNIPLMPFYNGFRIITGFLFILIILVFAIKLKLFKKPLFIFGLIWFIVFTTPAMFYRPDWSAYSYDYLTHRSYLPFAGIFIALSVFFNSVSFSRKKYISLTVLLILPLSLLSSLQVRAYKNALSFSKMATEENPRSALAMQYYANAKYMNNDFEKAIELYTSTIKLKGDFADAWLNRGMANAKVKKYTDAVSDFSTAYKLNPTNTRILKYKANAFFEGKMYQEAILSYNEYLIKNKSDAEIIFKRGQASFFLKKYTDAINDFSTVIKKYPDNNDAILMRGNAYIIIQENDKAILDFSSILKKDSTSIDSYNNLGFIYLEKSKPDSALVFFLKALKINQNHSDACLGAAIAENMKNNSDAAQKYFEKACSLEPQLKQGMSGISALEKQGYFYSEKQKILIQDLFRKYQK